MTEAPVGMSRFVVKGKIAIGRDFDASHPDGSRAWHVDGKWGMRPQAEIQDASGAVTHRVRGTLIGIPRQLTISDAAGNELAFLKAKAFSPVRNAMTITLADGADWALAGNFLEKEYAVTSQGRTVILITQKFLVVRDTFTVDVADGVDPGLAMAVLWAVDRFVEQRG